MMWGVRKISEIRAASTGSLTPEQATQKWNVTQDGDLGFDLGIGFANQAADDNGLVVFDHHRIFNGTF